MPARTLILLAALAAPALADEEVAPHRIFATSRFSMDEILRRPYGPDVPFGSTGDRLWASSPQGWAFRDDVHWLYLTNLNAFDLQIHDEHGLLEPAEATYYPSHVHLEGAKRAIRADASFTFRLDNVRNPLSKPFRPEKRWTCWSSGHREDWYAVDYGSSRTFTGLRLDFFDDAPGGGCRPPQSYEVQRWDDGDWRDIPLAERMPKSPAKGENTVIFAEPTEASRLRVVVHNSGEDFYTGLYGFEPILADGADAVVAPGTPLEITADKFITPDDVLVVVMHVRNPSDAEHRLAIDPVLHGGLYRYGLLTRRIAAGDAGEPAEWLLYLDADGSRTLHDLPVDLHFRFAADDGGPEVVEHGNLVPWAFDAASGWRVLGRGPLGSDLSTYPVPPGKTLTFTTALCIVPRGADAKALDAVIPEFDARSAIAPALARASGRDAPALRWSPPENDPLADQVRRYQAWFDANLAYFDCSDEAVRKMYYHRAYALRKNMMTPEVGALKWPTQAEGRWRSTWYPNVISYGAGHQIREARWLRDPEYWRGHLRTWAVNEKEDGVYPSHVRPSGPAGGQYTDWITSTAWDGHLVHPSREFLAELVDELAANVRGWQNVYDPDGDGLLLVDSHWWTGMEYQPSFFAFADYKVAKDFSEPEEKVSLERVDLTSYNFGNAVAVARIYRMLEQPEKAAEFEALAETIAKAVLAKMWRDEGEFFYSLRASDDAVANVKEVIGVYPFYFGLPPVGEGYEAAWSSILDPEQFWTPWPVASASKRCPAYSQTNWPGDGRAAACMWNGPTWPHANSIVLTAMARTLRADRALKEGASPLTKGKLWELFRSFTKAQYRDGDLMYPWTGEYYNGETGAWKTAERDYNHSTWLDVLIPDLVGIVPRADDVLEVDPLLPPDALDYLILDGLHYRGHDVTVVWDAPGGVDVHDDGRTGLDVYLDGRLAASGEGLARLLVDLKTGRPPAAD